MKKLCCIMMILVLFSGLLACTQSPEGPSGEPAQEPSDSTTVRVGIVTDMGIDEAEWLQNLVSGLDSYMAENEGLDVRVVESTDVAEYEPKVRTLAEAGDDIIITMNSAMAEATTTVAADYPDVIFGSLDGTISDIANYENIQEFVLRVEDFHIPGNGGMALLDRVPGAVAAQEDAEVLRRDVFGLLVEELERRLVDEQDFSLAVQQDQPFLDGFEYLLEEALLFRQLDEEALEVLLLDMVDAVDQLVDGVLLHGGAVSLPGLHYV